MKIELGPKNCLYPLPTTLIGALVNGKPNYITIAHVGIMDYESVSLGMGKIHYTNLGIKANKTFSINIPSTKMIKETDFCGLVSGKNKNKADMFQTFYGKLKTAPMIEQCSINMECELIKTVDFPNHDIFIGKIVSTYCDDAVLTKGAVDFEKVQPILFVMNDRSYWTLGKKIAKAWDIGKELIK
ncbi:MAG: flavin reductase family protein [Candidatus Bathyarchaeia archaeon]|jgi:flavin reductase (DIM6/NTAB) family NADH-FMN oxidoreductase RutF